MAPISIVLTTLAGHAYNGEQSVSKALTSVLEGIVRYIEDARGRGRRLHVPNPSSEKENLSERWDANPSAYLAFERGMREFRRLWVQVVAKEGNVNEEQRYCLASHKGSSEEARDSRSGREIGGEVWRYR